MDADNEVKLFRQRTKFSVPLSSFSSAFVASSSPLRALVLSSNARLFLAQYLPFSFIRLRLRSFSWYKYNQGIIFGNVVSDRSIRD